MLIVFLLTFCHISDLLIATAGSSFQQKSDGRSAILVFHSFHQPSKKKLILYTGFRSEEKQLLPLLNLKILWVKNLVLFLLDVFLGEKTPLQIASVIK